MAKKKEKTLEEKLQEALVPENQWPYMLPENWCWTRLKYIANTVTGGTPSKKHDEYYGGDFPFYKPADLDSGRDLYSASEYLSDLGKNYAKFIPKGSVAVCCIGSIGKTGYFNIDGCTNQQINSIIPKINSLFVFYYASCDYFTNELWTKSSATTISIVNKSKMDDCYIPLPPLSEQKRIVHRIESLFAKLDEAKEKIQQVLDGAEMRKAAILHKAFTGELTQNWRKENSVSVSELLDNISDKLLKVKKKKIKKVSNLYSQSNIPHEWTWVELDDIAYKITDGEHATPKRVDNFCGFYLLSARNVRNDELKLDDVDYVAEDEYIRISKRCNPHMGDVLISCSGSVGRCCVITDNEKYVMVRSAAVISPILCNPKFIMYMIMSRDVQAQIKSLCKQTAQANLFIGAIASIKIPLPSLEEQDYIANLVGELFYKEKCSVEHCSKILFDIDTMKKSILAKAFRGELGTNNPTEDSALNLLKEVLQDQF